MPYDIDSRLKSDLRLSRRSPRTEKRYLHEARRFFAHFPKQAPERLGEAEVRKYLHHLVDVRRVSAYTHKMAVAAIKYLFEQTLGRPDEVKRIPWPKVVDGLPVVLAHADLVALFRAAAAVPLVRIACLCAYASGLRVSEVMRLQVPDVDSARGVLLVREGKGSRSRITVLPPRLLLALRRHWRETRPKGPWLFPGGTKAGHVGVHVLEDGFARARRAAGITRPGMRFHSLRHSFATHMLEAGVDVRILQALLGHKRVETTTRYAQVRTDLIARLPDPLELLAQTLSPR
jgi:site-specific recombinase XerD